MTKDLRRGIVTNERYVLIIWLSVLAAITLLTGSAAAQIPKIPDADWMTYNRTLQGDRYSPLKEITTANVKNLKPVATFDTGETVNFETGPIVVDGTMPGRYLLRLMEAKSVTLARGGDHGYISGRRLESGRGPRKEIAMKILVTGATGTVGSEVVKALLQRGAEVRALTRKQPEPVKLSDAVEITLGDLSDPVSVTQAMVGVDKFFLLIGNVADELTQALTAYGLAKKAGLKHVTYLSVYQADRFLDVPHFAAKHAVEEAIREGGVPYTILRPGYFMQNDRRLKPLLTGPGVYPVPLGNQGIAVVDVRDIAEAAAISLTEEGHAGKTYDLVSSEMLSGPGAAAIWSRLLGKDVKYAGHGAFDAFEAQLRKTGNPSWLAYDLRVMYQGYVERGFSHTESQTARFAALLGREPRKYSSYAEELTKQ